MATGAYPFLATMKPRAFARLLGLYIKIPGMRQEGSLRPTRQGIPLAKDSWLLGIGVSLLLSGVVDRASASSRKD